MPETRPVRHMGCDVGSGRAAAHPPIRVWDADRILSARQERMSGRRRHDRYQPARPWDARLRVLQDVIVQVEPAGQLVAFGHLPGVVGEVVRLDLSGGGRSISLDVKVGESRPVIVDGGVRHRLSFDVIGPAADEPALAGASSV